MSFTAVAIFSATVIAPASTPRRSASMVARTEAKEVDRDMIAFPLEIEEEVEEVVLVGVVEPEDSVVVELFTVVPLPPEFVPPPDPIVTVRVEGVVGLLVLPPLVAVVDEILEVAVVGVEVATPPLATGVVATTGSTGAGVATGAEVPTRVNQLPIVVKIDEKILIWFPLNDKNTTHYLQRT